MNKGKSVYTFQFDSDPSVVNKVIGDFLNANRFYLSNKYGENAYYSTDAINGNRGFQYSINGNTVNINAFLIAFGKQFFMLDSGKKHNNYVDQYNNLLTQLFDRIKNPNNPEYASIGSSNFQSVASNSQGAGNYAPPSIADKLSQSIKESIPQGLNNPKPITKQDVASAAAGYAVNKVNKYFEYMCESAFLVSIVGLILSCFGFVFTFIIYAADVVFAIFGLRTRRRKLAIATFVITGVSLIIIVAELIMLSMNK